MGWLIPNTGKDIEITTDGTYLKYRYVNSVDWQNILQISEIAGEPANGITTQTLTIPSVNSTVNVTVNRVGFVVIGSNILVRGIISGNSVNFNGQVTDINSLTNTLTIKALGYSGDGTGTLETGAKIVSSGVRGTTGASIDQSIIPIPSQPIAVNDYVLIRAFPWSATIDNIVHACSIGNAVFSLKIGSDSVGGITSVSSSGTQSTATATSANNLSAGDNLILSVTSVNSPIFSATIKLSNIS